MQTGTSPSASLSGTVSFAEDCLAAPRRPWLAGHAGVTLVELMAVVALISILSLLAYPRFRDIQEAGESRAVARGLVLTLKAAQQRAASLNRPAVAFFPDSSRLALFVDLDLDGTADLPGEADAMRFTGSSPCSGYPCYALAGRRSITANSFPVGASGKPQITLRSDGTIATGGSVTLLDDRGIAYQVQVTPTGAINLARQDGA